MDLKNYVIKKKDIKSDNKRTFETIFSLSNGHIGTRGSYLYDVNISNDSIDEGTFINGFYDSEPINYGESAFGYAKNQQTIQRVINPKQICFKSHGKIFEYETIDQELNMYYGTLTEDFIVKDDVNIIAQVRATRFVSMNKLNLLAIRYEVNLLDKVDDLEISTIFSREKNREDFDEFDPRKPKTDINRLQYKLLEDNVWKLTTLKSNLSLYASKNVKVKGGIVSSIHNNIDGSTTYYKPHINSNKVVIEEFYNYSNISINEQDVEDQTELNIINSYKEICFDSEMEAHMQYYRDFWKKSDFCLEGDKELQKNIRFNIFHLNQSAGRDGTTNIPAKGLSGDGYEGHYFWDTEMYMIPFFIYTEPSVAKSLLMYRHSILEEARKRARTMAISKGVLFPWRTINGEECSAYYPAGTAQVHINADIANAVMQYYTATNDEDFMINYGLEILIETARFWVQYGVFVDERFEIHCVTGPDEYTTLVDNNFYTNIMAQKNMLYASIMLNKFGQNSKIRELLSKIEYEADESITWEKAAEKMYFGKDDKLGITLQDSNSHKKAKWPFDTTEKDKYPLLLNFHPLTIYKHRVNKQADTVLAQFLFRAEFDKTQLKTDYAYYKSITTHDSSLSKSIYSMMAAYLGKEEDAYKLFMDTVHTDLHDQQNNTIDGIHAANMGGMWICLVNGFAGISIQDGIIHIDPKLPKEWNKMSFNFQFQGALLNIELSSKTLSLSKKIGDDISVIVNDEKYRLEKDTLIIHL